MAHNREALARRALMELRLIGEGQSASAEDTSEALAAIPQLLERLRFLQIYSASNPYAFSDAVLYPLAVLLAEDLAPALAGRPKNLALAEHQEGRLRRIQNQPLLRNEARLELALQTIREAGSKWP